MRNDMYHHYKNLKYYNHKQVAVYRNRFNIEYAPYTLKLDEHIKVGLKRPISKFKRLINNLPLFKNPQYRSFSSRTKYKPRRFLKKKKLKPRLPLLSQLTKRSANLARLMAKVKPKSALVAI